MDTIRCLLRIIVLLALFPIFIDRVGTVYQQKGDNIVAQSSPLAHTVDLDSPVRNLRISERYVKLRGKQCFQHTA